MSSVRDGAGDESEEEHRSGCLKRDWSMRWGPSSEETCPLLRVHLTAHRRFDASRWCAMPLRMLIPPLKMP